MGAFELVPDVDDDSDFNLRPRDNAASIPDDQMEVNRLVYEARNILILLRDHPAFQHAFPNPGGAFGEFIRRVKQAARTGTVNNHVHVDLARSALQQIRDDIMRRAAKPIIYRYLGVLAVWAFVGAVIAGVFIRWIPASLGVAGYGWIVLGSMVGAWLSAAASRREVTFAGLQDFLDIRFDPPIRMLFVAALAVIIALFLQVELLKIEVAGMNLSAFRDNVAWAIVLGALIGISEQVLSVKVIERARQALAL